MSEDGLGQQELIVVPEKSELSDGFGEFRIERREVPATEIFSQRTKKNLLEGRKARAEHAKAVEAGEAEEHAITTQEALWIQEDDIPEELREQVISGEQLERQAEALLNTPLLNEIKGSTFTEARHKIKKLITKSALEISNWAKKKSGIVLRHGGPSQIALAYRTFLNNWKEGIDVYKALCEVDMKPIMLKWWVTGRKVWLILISRR